MAIATTAYHLLIEKVICKLAKFDVEFDISEVQEISQQNDSGFMLGSSLEILNTDESEIIQSNSGNEEIEEINPKKKAGKKIHRPCPFQPCKDKGNYIVP